MGPLAGLLHRLRRFGAPPGRPADAIAVPASPVEDAAAELAPVFAALDDLDAEVRRRRARGPAEAAAILDAARQEVARIGERAERAATEIAVESRAAAARDADAQRAAILAEADAEVERVRAVAAARGPALVALLLEEVDGVGR